ncbi:hypothetical protein RR42_s2929 [Cupriavidus basilensis]|uniref:Uncharacterized protein n=1 Tax=Cupriavidus basilensis TaxID=68895 RepID=A0A0C4YPU1_9BURK|nr:hypothetical protein RR42_s2929 [Cupriavidus basilensis]
MRFTSHQIGSIHAKKHYPGRPFRAPPAGKTSNDTQQERSESTHFAQVREETRM